ASDAGSGTPGYMAPEQLAGQEASVASDLFALGLVLYELFTGRRAFPSTSIKELEQRYREGPPSRPSSLVGGLAPAVEAALLRCLEAEPAKRPPSAAEVLAALPGGDPLAAALAAGETPSPRLVADAGEGGLVGPRLGLALFGALAAGLALFAFAADQVMLYRQA